jgi:hypothetical protein
MRSSPETPTSPGRTEGFRIPPGPSIIEKLWAELDIHTGKMMEIRTAIAKAGFGEEPFSDGEVQGQRGYCLGLAKALAMLHNPYDPNIGEIREEAMRRWREKTRGSNE